MRKPDKFVAGSIFSWNETRGCWESRGGRTKVVITSPPEKGPGAWRIKMEDKSGQYGPLIIPAGRSLPERKAKEREAFAWAALANQFPGPVGEERG